MAYSELIKDFERIRDYMRDFYVYGFKSREDFTRRSARSYDDERRRIESYLGDYMQFSNTTGGKNIFLSIDSRSTQRNPLYRALKAKSFTDRDITLHFILLDILYAPEVLMPLDDIMEAIDGDYLACFDEPLSFDESTVRKKLKEYEELGLITKVKHGRQVLYRRTDEAFGIEQTDNARAALQFFSEAGLCGVIGSYMLDELERLSAFEQEGRETCGKSLSAGDVFTFKHHYITHALESDILWTLLEAVSQKRSVSIINCSPRESGEKSLHVVPMKIFISAQSGRQHLLCYDADLKHFRAYRIDYIKKAETGKIIENFDALRKAFDEMQRHMWGVNCKGTSEKLEHVEFTVNIGHDEEYIYGRLEREKRCGNVQRIDETTARFTADVYDANEMIPWIRTFICRITDIKISNRNVEERFKRDLNDMYRIYGIDDAADMASPEGFKQYD